MNFLKVLRTPHLAILWSGQMLSAIGDQCFSVAIIWITTHLLGSMAGIVAALGSLVALLAGLPGGVLADRWPRRETMIYTDLLRALLTCTFTLLAISGTLQIWQLILLSMGLEALGAIFEPALIASLPQLTRDGQQLSSTNALMDGTLRMARILGPGLTGLLLMILPLTHFFTLDAISFALSALSILLLARRFPTRSSMLKNVQAGEERGHIFEDILIAFHHLREHRALTWALGSLGLVNMAWSATFFIGIPLLVARIPGANAGTYGLIVAVYGVGSVLGLFLTGSFASSRNLSLLYGGQVVLGLGFLLIGFTSTPILIMIGAAIAAFCDPVGDLILLIIIQTDFPIEHVGKMYSLRRLIAGTGQMLGSALAAPLFASLHIATGIILCSLAMILIGSISLLHERIVRRS
ncbi:MFS transporter [Ktedonosporobacter rubrisoli]|uniref:MFS transporter n=1 Tax=Ktedonosporobacter rubrisoli TaxID=2509675 RepID=A0A4V0YYL5_KTERU|nr:MFS transporter [Ktedonosporobacter rubrisoli]QBD76641.1 MFS transporter [Ktedonosporobacter rubrisoli]